jgi:hypothetical protein
MVSLSAEKIAVCPAKSNDEHGLLPDPMAGAIGGPIGLLRAGYDGLAAAISGDSLATLVQHVRQVFGIQVEGKVNAYETHRIPDDE